MGRLLIVSWMAALAVFAAPSAADAQSGGGPCDKNHYILHQKCSPEDFPGVVTTGIATKTAIGAPTPVAVDAQGNVFFGNDHGAIYRVDPSGVLTLVLYQPRGFYDDWGDYWYPKEMGAVDRAGNVYLIDIVDNLVQRLGADGTIVTVAGRMVGDSPLDDDPSSAAAPSPRNGVAVGAHATDMYFTPTAVAVDGAGNLYIANDLDGIFKVAPDGTVASFVPYVEVYGSFAVDDAGTLFAAAHPCLVISISASGAGDVVAGSTYGYSQNSPTCLYSGDGVAATTAGIGMIGSVALSPDGSLYIADTQFNCIHRVGADGIIRMFAGSCPGPWQFPGVVLIGPKGVAVDAGGNVYIADTGNERVLKVTPDGVTTTIAGIMPAVPRQP